MASMRPSGAPPYWPPGTPITWRYRRDLGVTIESVAPMLVVADDADQLVAWLPSGTPVLRPVLPDGRDLRSVGAVEMYASGRALRRDTWHGHGNLRIAPTGAPWSVYVFWRDDGTFRGWYVNFEAPHQRDDHGIVSEDRILDLLVAPDRSVHWKDVDELEGAVVAGRFTRADANSFLADAHDVVARVTDWASPFGDGWERWRPDPAWSRPQLPAGLVAEY